MVENVLQYLYDGCFIYSFFFFYELFILSVVKHGMLLRCKNHFRTGCLLVKQYKCDLIKREVIHYMHWVISSRNVFLVMQVNRVDFFPLCYKSYLSLKFSHPCVVMTHINDLCHLWFRPWHVACAVQDFYITNTLRLKQNGCHFPDNIYK